MQSLTKSINGLEIITEFVDIQAQLIKKFRDSFPHIRDFEYLLDCPKCGVLEVLEEKWSFHRHGKGVCFTGEKSGRIVDVHTGIFSDLVCLDSWRLSQYFDSLKIQQISYNNQIFNLYNEQEIEDLIHQFNLLQNANYQLLA